MSNLPSSVCLNGKFFLNLQYSEDMKHKTTLLELQKMFTYLMVCLRIGYGKLIRYTRWPKVKTLIGVHLYWPVLTIYSYFANWLCQLLMFFVIVNFNCHISVIYILLIYPLKNFLYLIHFSSDGHTSPLSLRVFQLIFLCPS